MIPTINFTKLQTGTADELRLLKRACQEWGVFYLNGTGVSDHTIANIFKRSKQFFNLSEDQKRSLDIKKSDNFCGYVGEGEETTRGKPDLKESLEFAQEGVRPLENGHLPFYQLFGTNMWPSESWIPGFKADVSDYIKQIETLGNQLIQSFSQSLDIPADDPYISYYRPLHYRTRLMNYESLVDLPVGEIRIHEHTDMALFNILLLDSPGLEAKNIWGEWLPVLPQRNAFVIILGELTQIWSDGQYRAGVHRVRNSVQKQRLSMPFFFYPNLLSPVKSINVAVAGDVDVIDERQMLTGEMLWNRLNDVH